MDRNDISEERLEWIMMTPTQRFLEYEKMFALYRDMGGSLDPEYDIQSPFNSVFEGCRTSSDGRSGLHIIRRSGV
jgi:hypothetical protein